MLILFFFLFLTLGTTVAFVIAAVQGAIIWAFSAIAGQGVALFLIFWWFKRHPELENRRSIDIATVVGMIALGTMAALGFSNFPSAWVDPDWVLILIGAPVSALLLSFPLKDIVAFVPSIRHTVLLPQAVADGMMSELTARHGQPVRSEAESGAVASATEARWVRPELETGSRMLAKLRQYLLASGAMVSLFVLIGELSETHDAAMAIAIARSVVPFACGLGFAQLVCLPLQTKLENYARYLNGASQRTSSF